jgi:hypothetical protein
MVRSFQLRAMDDPWSPQVSFSFSAENTVIHQGEKVEPISQCRMSGLGVDTGWKNCSSPVDIEAWGQMTLPRNQSFDFEVRLWIPQKEKAVQLGSTTIGKQLPRGHLNGQIFTMSEDSSGNFFLGGNFVYSDGRPRRGIHAQSLSGETLWDHRSIEFGFGEASLSMIEWVPSQEKFYVGGTFSSYNGQSIPSGLVRLNEDLTLDTSFSIPSEGFTDLGGAARPVKAIYVYGNGRILALGQFHYVGGLGRTCIVLLEPNGTMVTPQPQLTGFNWGCDIRDVTEITIGATPNLVFAGNFSSFGASNNASGLISVLPGDFSIQSWGLLDGFVNTVYPLGGELLMAGGSFTDNEGQPLPENLAVLRARLGTTFEKTDFGEFSANAAGVSNEVRSITGFSVGPNAGYAVVGNFVSFDIQHPSNPSPPNTNRGIFFINNNGRPFDTANTHVGTGCLASTGSGSGGTIRKAVADSTRGLLWISQNCTQYNGQKVPLGVIPIDLRGGNIGNIAPEIVHVDALKIQAPVDFVLSQDKIVSVGSINGVAGENIYAAGILKLDPSGKPVVPESPNARQVFDQNQSVRAIEPLPDGRLLVGGGIWDYGPTGDSPDYLAVLNHDFTLSQDLPEWQNVDGLVRGITRDLQGGYLVYGDFTNLTGTAGSDPRGLFRLNPDLSLDHTFNNSLGSGLGGVGPGRGANKVVVEPGTGTYWIAGLFSGIGSSGSAGCEGLCTLRRNPSTGVAELVSNSIGSGTESTINDLIQLPDKKWLVTGNFSSWNDSTPTDSPSKFTYRLMDNGSLDTTFAPRFNLAPLSLQYWPAFERPLVLGNFGLVRDSTEDVPAQSIAFLNPSTGYLSPTPLESGYESGTVLRGSFVDSKNRLWIYGDFGVHLNHQRQVAVEVFDTNGKRIRHFPQFTTD